MLRKLRHFIKNWYGRLTKGAGCCDGYSLNSFLAPKIRDGLAAMIEQSYRTPSHPCDLPGMKEWRAELRQMHDAFDEFIKDEFPDPFIHEEIQVRDKRIQDGIDLFAKRFFSLWL